MELLFKMHRLTHIHAVVTNAHVDDGVRPGRHQPSAVDPPARRREDEHDSD